MYNYMHSDRIITNHLFQTPDPYGATPITEGTHNFDTSLYCDFGKTHNVMGVCADCSMPDCMICQLIDSNYANSCRYCDQPVTIMCSQSTGCPDGYYQDKGVCYSCPVGCKTCTD